MGMAYPQYGLTDEQLATIRRVIKEIKDEYFRPEDLPKITHRPLRASELNTALTADTRTYYTVLDNTTITGLWHMVCATDTAAASITVPTGSVYLILGWIFIDWAQWIEGGVDATALSFGLNSVGQVKVNGVLKNETALPIVSRAQNNMILTLDQIVVAPEQSELLVQVKGTDEGQALVFPLAYRIGPKSQLDVS